MGPQSEDHPAQAQGAGISFLGFFPGEVGGGTHRAAVFQQCEERMETQMLQQLPTSTAFTSGKCWLPGLERDDFLHILVVSSGVTSPSSTCISPLTTERVHTESGLSSSDSDIYICTEEVHLECLGVLEEALEKGADYVGVSSGTLHSRPTLKCELELLWAKFPLNRS